MDPLHLVIIAIHSLKTNMVNPRIGGGSTVTLQGASDLLAILGSLILPGGETLDDLEEFSLMVQAMANEGRGPTRDEMQFLQSRSDDAHELLQIAVDDLMPEEDDAADEASQEEEVSTETEEEEDDDEDEDDEDDEE